MLRDLLDASGIPRDRIIIIRTDPDALVPTDVAVLDDFECINIQRWWNVGIDEAVRRGATEVILANDDIVVGPDTMTTLAQELVKSGATLATPGSRRQLHRSRWTIQRRLDGSLWALSIRDGLRPDESYRWAYGDDELDLQARRRHNGVLTVPVAFEHPHHNAATAASAQLRALSVDDEATFRRRHPATWISRQPRALVRRMRRTGQR
jgi:hypothetical protein